MIPSGRTWVTATLVLSGYLAGPALADSAPDDVVRTFNNAISTRDLDTALAQLADGGVVIQLRPPHPGMPADPPLTGDLVKTWQMVGAILFPSTQAYSRVATITEVTEKGDIATVWADTTTTTQRKGVAEPMVLSFSEMYLLVKKNGTWKIAANADNRQPDTITVSDSAAP